MSDSAKIYQYPRGNNKGGMMKHNFAPTMGANAWQHTALGYFVETVVLNSNDFGVPQNRERIFFIGHLAEPGGSIREVLPFGEDGQLPNDSGNTNERRSQAKYSTSLKASGAVKADDTFIAEQARNPKKRDDLIQVGNVNTAGHNSLWGRVYSPDGLAAHLNANGGGMGAKTGLYVVPEATKQGYAIAGPGDSINLAVPNSKTRRGRVGKGVANTLETSCNQATVQGHRIRRLTPIECERLQAFPDHWTEKGLFENGEVKDISDSQRYKCLGNAVTVSVIAWLVERILSHNEAMNGQTT